MVTIDTLRERKIETPTAVALGYFDGVHRGHRAVIGNAHSRKARGLDTCVFSFSVTTQNPESGKGRLNITTSALKQEQMRLLGVDYYVVPDFSEFKELEPEEFVNLLTQRLCAKEVYCGANFRFGRRAKGDVSLLARLCAAADAALTIVPDVLEGDEPVSSSRIRALLEQGSVQRAGMLLGRPYSYDCPVTQGRRLGRSIGSPTINQYFESQLLVPRYGVYASFVRIDGRLLPGVTNIGVRPTVDENSPPLSETCILGFEGDLYGRRVEVSLIHYLRGERRFASVEQLRDAIANDKQSVTENFDAWLAQTVL
ncbi:MAG: riboflavin biosynthesis protein RibF [Acetanaerobacterium sp.]